MNGAARVGQAGAGFSVVAEEIRRLSDDTKEAINRIQHSLDSVVGSIQQMESNFREITTSSQEQAQLVINFSEVIEKLNEMTEQLETLLNKISMHAEQGQQA